MENLEKLFHMLGNKNRLQILSVLAKRGSAKSFVQLKEVLDFNPNTLSFHLGALEDAKLIRHSVKDSDRKHSFYEITDKGRELFSKYCSEK
jgi:DNA-binding HxlR family transcriptional regulator